MQNPNAILDTIHERSIDLIMESFLVLADVYRDQGNHDAADCLTWLAKERKYPTFYEGDVSNTLDDRIEEVIGFQWYAESTSYPQSELGLLAPTDDDKDELFHGSKTFADAVRLAIRLWPQIQEANQIGVNR